MTLFANALNSTPMTFFRFFYIFMTISLIVGSKMTVGLPIPRQEHGSDQGVLTGNDFLNMFMESAFNTDEDHYEESYETTSTATIMTSKKLLKTYPSRTTRSTSSLTPYVSSGFSSYNILDKNNQYDNSDNNVSSDSKQNDGVVVAVRVSSTIDAKIDQKELHKENLFPVTSKFVPEISTNKPIGFINHDVAASEHRPSIFAAPNKPEYNVPDQHSILDYSQNYPGSTHSLPEPSSHLTSFKPQSDYINSGANVPPSKTKLSPFHQTVIYHNSDDQNQARSVSYSTVIQTIPHSNSQDTTWKDEKLLSHERQERHYDGSKTAEYINSFENTNNKQRFNVTQNGLMSQNVENDNRQSSNLRNSWDNPIRNTESDSVKSSNWLMKESKPFNNQRANIYGQPEQNYEVDESVSVVSNGRAHGVQPVETEKPPTMGNNSAKKDDSQKVGYVVEGRNYRKYRVEERTSDGFIVGEYGVVSHDDGSLRGVRYTADGTINPRLIYDALMKFLSL